MNKTPLPTPKPDEEEPDFISRCMGNDTMKSEYPDQKQRAAVCYSQWRKKHGEGQDSQTPKRVYDLHFKDPTRGGFFNLFHNHAKRTVEYLDRDKQKRQTVLAISESEQYQYHDKDFPHGCRCSICYHLFVEGEYYTTISVSDGIEKIVCLKCGGLHSHSKSDKEGEKELKEKAQKILESLVPWKAKVLLAKPGLSKNGYNWTKEELEKAAPNFANKVVMTDHSSDCKDLVGITTGSFYGEGAKGEALYAEAVGLMSKELFDQTQGMPEKGIPPLLRGVSMGGIGNLKHDPDNEYAPPDVVDFEPLEWSYTPFPAVSDAEVLEIMEIKESFVKREKEKMLELPATVDGVPLADIPVVDLTEEPEPKKEAIEIKEVKPPALVQGTDQATIEANIVKLEEQKRIEDATKPPPTEPPKPETLESYPNSQPADGTKEAEKPDELAALKEWVETLSKQIEELKKPKPVSAENQPSALPVDSTPHGPMFESQSDIIKRFNELKAHAMEEQKKFSPKLAWKKVAYEALSEKQAEKQAWKQVVAEVTKQFEEA